MRGRIARGVGALAWVTCALVALALAATFVPTFFGLQSFIVASGSMGRAMPVGSVALTREVDAHAVGVGDVISYRRRTARETTTHRVLAVEVQGSQVLFTTKGDANGGADAEPVVVDGRIHRLEYVVPGVGYLIRYARSPIGLVVLFLVPIIGLTVDRPLRAVRARRRRRRTDDDTGWSSTTFTFEHLATQSIANRPWG